MRLTPRTTDDGPVLFTWRPALLATQDLVFRGRFPTAAMTPISLAVVGAQAQVVRPRNDSAVRCHGYPGDRLTRSNRGVSPPRTHCVTRSQMPPPTI